MISNLEEDRFKHTCPGKIAINSTLSRGSFSNIPRMNLPDVEVNKRNKSGSACRLIGTEVGRHARFFIFIFLSYQWSAV